MTASYVLVVGRTPDLALAELKSVFKDVIFHKIASNCFQADIQELENPQETIEKLGGTIKIAKIVRPQVQLSAEEIAQTLIKLTTGHAFTFGVSTIGVTWFNEKELQECKKILHNHGFHARYVVGKESGLLSSAVSLGQHIIELLVFKNQDETVTICHVEASQNIRSWAKRDYERPFVDPKRGMLPPKVARMVVNIAHSALKNPQNPILLDPFCGVGTILAEAMLCGWSVIGSDIDKEIVAKAKKNIIWVENEWNLPGVEGSYAFFTSDATHISECVTENSIDAIVTEPFLGSTKLIKNKNMIEKDVKNIVKGLEKLYTGSLKNWKKILTSNGIVIMALPVFTLHGKAYTVNRIVDRCENFGYSIIQGPYYYGREAAFVKRAFYVFQKTGSAH